MSVIAALRPAARAMRHRAAALLPSNHPGPVHRFTGGLRDMPALKGWITGLPERCG